VMVSVLSILRRVRSEHLQNGPVDGVLGVADLLVLVPHGGGCQLSESSCLARVERLNLRDTALELHDPLLDLVGREVLDLGRWWRRRAARRHRRSPHARKTSGGNPEATTVEENVLKKKAPLVGLVIGAAW